MVFILEHAGGSLGNVFSAGGVLPLILEKIVPIPK
jgi:hypothetical protein